MYIGLSGQFRQDPVTRQPSYKATQSLGAGREGGNMCNSLWVGKGGGGRLLKLSVHT